jgi:prepilin-type N-terminal cleavage/methylation domain-containing protein/prepilin-type processing-associated H-X9-DG protein
VIVNKHPKYQEKAGYRGFTLLELLIVISIIAFLLSIMMPQVSKAREQAQRIKCQSDIRNLTFAWQAYSIDNRDRLCSANTGWNDMGGDNWVGDGPDVPGNLIGGTVEAIKEGVLWRYIKAIEIYKCRTDRSELLRSCAISRTMNGQTCGCVNDNINPFKSYPTIRQPSERLVFTDATSRTGWIDGSFCPVNDIKEEPLKWTNRLNMNITARHDGGTNISLADGHCEYLKWKDRRTIELAQWNISPAEASDNNPDLLRLAEMIKGQ